MQTIRYARARAERQTTLNRRFGFPQRGRVTSVRGATITAAVNVLFYVPEHKPWRPAVGPVAR